LSQTPDMLRRKLSEILSWEKRKRREEILAAIFFYALLGAALAVPLYPSFLSGVIRWLVPVGLGVALAPFCFFTRRWRQADSVRALARADRALRLEERALTAWELLRCNDQRAAALLVFKEASEKLARVDAKTLLRRSWSWQAYFVLPVLAGWVGIMGINPRFEFGGGSRLSTPTWAQELRRFARQLQDKAKSEGLRASFHLGQELEKVAQKGIDSNESNERLKTEVTGMMQKIDSAERAAPEQESLAAGESAQSLTDLQAELEAAQDMLNFRDGDRRMQNLGPEWLDRLASLPQLKRQFDKSDGPQRSLSRSGLKSFLDRLERQVTGELDRRALLDARRVLERMIKEREGEKGDSDARIAGPGKAKNFDSVARGDNSGPLPGTEPGQKTDGLATRSQPPAGAATRLDGIIGVGPSLGVLLKGKPGPEESKVSQEEIIASYRRQAEAELNSERVPEALKETIKNYFLSLSNDARK
jgi:hypothetical protein